MLRKKTSGDWLEGTLTVFKSGGGRVTRPCQLVGDTFFFFNGRNEAVAGFLELRNLKMLTQPNSEEPIIEFEMPVKQFFRSSLIRFGISPFDQGDRLRWFQALHNIVSPVHSGFLELGRRFLGFTFWKRKWFRLHQLSLCYFNSNQTLNRCVEGSLSLVPECVPRAVGLATIELYTAGGGGHASKVWLLRSDTQEISDTWLHAIRQVLAMKNGEVPVSAELELVGGRTSPETRRSPIAMSMGAAGFSPRLDPGAGIDLIVPELVQVVPQADTEIRYFDVDMEDGIGALAVAPAIAAPSASFPSFPADNLDRYLPPKKRSPASVAVASRNRASRSMIPALGSSGPSPVI